MEITLEELFQKDLSGKVVIFETDTVYGIGCLLNDELAIEKIYAIKKRDKKNPLAVLVGNMEDAYKLIRHPKRLKPYAAYYWPGAMTFVCKKSKQVDDITSRGFNTVGIRMPKSERLRRILNHFGPMMVSSLNTSNTSPVLKYESALAYEKSVDYIVNGSDLNGTVSTVFDIDKNLVLREGPLKV